MACSQTRRGLAFGIDDEHAQESVPSNSMQSQETTLLLGKGLYCPGKNFIFLKREPQFLSIFPAYECHNRITLSRDNPNSVFYMNGLLNTAASPTPAPTGLGLLAQAMVAQPQNTLLTGLASLATQPADPQKWIYVTARFKTFQDNLALTASQVEDGERKYKGVVSCLNAAYWGHNSETLNAFLIGSWAKDTRIRPPRDVDLYFLLPLPVYQRFESYAQSVNKQSALLQEVKGKLLASYPSSSIKGDGPVVLAGFTSYNVEIVPAFLFNADDRSYYVCDTKSGGRYMTTKPLHEVDAIEAADVRNNCNVRPLIRMLKCWQACCSVPIKSFYLELLAIEFLDQWKYKDRSYFFYDWMCRDFFTWLVTKANSFVMTPGTWDIIWIGEAWKSRAENAGGRALKACDYERANDMLNAGDEWQKIFGTDIPRIV